MGGFERNREMKSSAVGPPKTPGRERERYGHEGKEKIRTREAIARHVTRSASHRSRGPARVPDSAGRERERERGREGEKVREGERERGR